MEPINAKEEVIIQAAIRLFARYGIRKTTMEDIARAAGIAKGTIYLHFKNKDDVLAVAMERICKDMYRALEAAVERESTLAGKLKSFILERLRFPAAQIELYGATVDTHMELELYTHTNPMLISVVDDYHRAERSIIEGLLQSGIDKGQWTIKDIRLTACTISSAMDGLDKHWEFRDVDVSLEQKAEVLVRLLIEGMKNRT